MEPVCAWQRHATGMQEAGSDMDVMMASIHREVQERTAASLRLKAGLLSYFCNNMRRRCRAEVQQRCAPVHCRRVSGRQESTTRP